VASTKHWVPKINRHARVYVQKTVANFLTMGSNTQYAKRRPGTVTAIPGNVTFRVRHHGETYAAVPRQIDATVPVGGDAAAETRAAGAAVRTGKYVSQ